jgi:hypothetical protein
MRCWLSTILNLSIPFLADSTNSEKVHFIGTSVMKMINGQGRQSVSIFKIQINALLAFDEG